MQVRHESHNIGGGRRRRQGQRRQQVQARKGEECTCVFMLEADNKERGAGGHGRVRSQRACQRQEVSKVGPGLKLVHRFFRVFVVSFVSSWFLCRRRVMFAVFLQPFLLFHTMNPISHILELSRPSYVCNGRDYERINTYHEGARQWLQREMRRFLLDRRDDPVLLWYSSDTTPLSTSQSYKRVLQNLSVLRRGRESHEYVVQRLFAHDGFNSIVLVEEPIKLSDKTASSHFEVFRSLMPLPKHIGSRNIVVHSYVWDGALLSACRRLTQQYHAASVHHLSQGLEPGEARLLDLTSWTSFCLCVNHSIHGALKWAILEFINDKMCVKNCFVVVESLRNSYGQLVANVGPWLRSVIKYEDWDMSHQTELWTVLGMEPEWAERMAEMQVRFSDGHLRVAASFEDDETVVEDLITIFLQALRLKKISDSRWVSLGGSCRTLVCSFAIGLSSLVDFVLRSPSESRYFLSGFLRMDTKVKKMVSIASICSYLPDTILGSLLEDDRVPRMLHRLDEEVWEELSFVANISADVWCFIQATMGFEGNLKNDCITATTIAAGFINCALRPARKLPWTLCIGNLDENVDKLMRGPLPSEEISLKIVELVGLGYNRADITKALELLGQVSWSATATEQAHVAASSIMKQHKAYGEDMMRSRAFLLQLRPLLVDDLEHRKVASLQARLEQLDKKRPDRINGRHVLVQDLAALVASKKTRDL